MKNHRILTFVGSLIYALSVNLAMSVDLYEQMKGAVSRPLFEFCQTVTSAPPVALPSPGAGQAPNQQIADMIWNRLVSHSFEWKQEQSDNADLYGLKSLHEWLVDKPSYTNLVLAAFIEEMMARAVVRGVAENHLEPSKALQIIGDLRAKTTNFKSVLEIVSDEVPGSQALLELQSLQERGELMDLVWASDKLATELGESSPCRPEELRKEIRLAGFMAYLARAGSWSLGAEGLLVYASKGGNLNEDANKLRTEIKQMIPEFFEKKNPLTGSTFYPVELVETRDLILNTQ